MRISRYCEHYMYCIICQDGRSSNLNVLIQFKLVMWLAYLQFQKHMVNICSGFIRVLLITNQAGFGWAVLKRWKTKLNLRLKWWSGRPTLSGGKKNNTK